MSGKNLAYTAEQIDALLAGTDEHCGCSTNPHNVTAEQIAATVVALVSGADMDTYTTAGSYISTSSTTTGTLLHIPQGVAGKGFALDIIQTAANAIVQRIVCMQVSASQPRVFYRGGRNADGWAFGAWYEVTMVAES